MVGWSVGTAVGWLVGCWVGVAGSSDGEARVVRLGAGAAVGKGCAARWPSSSAPEAVPANRQMSSAAMAPTQARVVFGVRRDRKAPAGFAVLGTGFGGGGA